MREYYKRVNAAGLHGSDDWNTSKLGLHSGEFTVMDTLNDTAHLSFASLLIGQGWRRHPEYRISAEVYAKHVDRLLSIWRYLIDMYGAGKSREDIEDGVRAMNRPDEFWVAESKKARENAANVEAQCQ